MAEEVVIQLDKATVVDTLEEARAFAAWFGSDLGDKIAERLDLLLFLIELYDMATSLSMESFAASFEEPA